MQTSVEKIIELIQTEKFVIYGNGYIAKRLYRVIEKMGCIHHISHFAVTETKAGEMGIDGKKLYNIKAINRNDIVLLAVHNVAVDEMRKVLNELQCQKYIWIYPFLFDLELGFPIVRGKQIGLDKLLQKIGDSYTPAIYYLALKDYCENNNPNGVSYKKFFLTYTTLEMANKRWDMFRHQIDDYSEFGYKQDHNIKIDENYYILDGLHRVILAKYFRIGKILVDIYKVDGEFYSLNGPGGNIHFGEADLPKYYTVNEIEAIKAADRELRGIG